MTTTVRRAALLLTVAALAALTVNAAPAPVPGTTNETVKDRATFVPQNKYQSLPGKAVGILVSDVQAKMAHDGRGGPADAMGFSLNGNSYRWVYVPVTQNVLITNLQVKVGEKGEGTRVYPTLSMASPTTVKQWNITVPYALVEVEVNDGLAAPADQAFVGTKMTRLDGTREFPFDVTKAVADMRERHTKWKNEQRQALETALADAQKKAIKDRKATGPREASELFYVTWMADTQRLRVCFRSTVTDGDYKYTEGGVRPGPFPLPPRPVKDAAPPPRLPPPPIELPRVRYGTSFGIEFGVAYEVDKNGKVVRTLTLPVESFQRELPPPPRIGPRDLPPRLPPIKD
jgi:hypothetical protein